MNDKIEIAKLATQLTIAVLENKNGQILSITHAEKAAGAKETPDAMIVFDVVFKHLQATLSAQ